MRIITISLLSACTHDAARGDVAPLPRILRPPDLVVAPVFEPVGDPCENAQVAGVPVSPECVVAGETSLQAILADPHCRVPLPAADGFYCTRPHVIMDADRDIVVAPGATAIVHVTLTPAGDAEVLVDFDPQAKLEVESTAPERTGLCVVWAAAPTPSPSPDRARVLLRPNAVVHAEIPWHATWTDVDDRCTLVQRALPRGHYTLAIPNPAYPIELQQADWEYGTPPSVVPIERVGEVR